MFGMDRFWVELVGVIVLIGALAGWWTEHNRKEQTVGAQACVQTYTETQGEGIAKTAAIEADHTATLQRVSDAYVQQIAAINADRDSLAQRLHDRAAQDGHSTVPATAAAAGKVCAAGNNPGPTARDRREATDLDACAKNTIELIQLRQAWAELAAKQ